MNQALQFYRKVNCNWIVTVKRLRELCKALQCCMSNFTCMQSFIFLSPLMTISEDVIAARPLLNWIWAISYRRRWKQHKVEAALWCAGRRLWWRVMHCGYSAFLHQHTRCEPRSDGIRWRIHSRWIFISFLHPIKILSLRWSHGIMGRRFPDGGLLTYRENESLNNWEI